MSVKRTTKKGNSKVLETALQTFNTKKKQSSTTISQGSLSNSGIEIYKTKDKNVEKTSKDEEKEGYVLQNSTITEIAYYNEVVSDSFEEDYEDISTNASISLMKVDETRFYKGKKIALKKAYNPTKWKNLKQVHLGFITEQSYSEDGVDLKISGMSKLLDQEKKFKYKKTKISKILKDIITSAGLKAKIDTTGLKDSKVDYTNVSSSSSSSSSSGIGSEEIDSLVQEIIGDETDDLTKAKKIHAWLIKKLTYTGYSCSKYSTAEKCLKSKKLNCADTSRLTCAMMKSAGLNATVVHGPNHFWTIIKINGKEYASDATSHSRAFNKVWKGLSYYSKCGDEPSC